MSSLPEEVQGEMYRMLNMQNKEITQATLGEIHQTCIVALDKLCNQQQVLEGILKNHKRYSKNCKKNYLEIKSQEHTQLIQLILKGLCHLVNFFPNNLQKAILR